MTVKSFWHGNEIIHSGGEWHYSDTGQPVKENPDRECGHCKRLPIKDGEESYDGCMGRVGGPVTNACCGHGIEKEAYVQFGIGSKIDGKDAIEYIKANKRAG